jgi:hypothetical protein
MIAHKTSSTTAAKTSAAPKAKAPFALVACCVATLALGACSKATPEPPVAVVVGFPGSGPAGDTSVPAADSVLSPPASEVKTDAAAGRSNKAMSVAQESGAMPMAGQNNDHSAPLAPARRASAP